MKKSLKIVTLAVIILLVCLCTGASAAAGDFSFVDYSDEYKAYLNLSDEEKEKTLEPSTYNAEYANGNEKFIGGTNFLRSVTSVRSAVDTAYSLQNVIPNNVVIRNQASTNSCWAYATIGALETNIALQDYRAGNTDKIYDFSERHMMYGITRNFNNGQINPYGFTRKVAEGGNFLHAETYLSNGMGAVNEADMPFEDNMNDLDISAIQNKTVTSTLYDTVMFERMPDIEKDALMLKMKQHITTYGGIYAAIHGAQVISDAYNPSTGAIYCSSNEEYPIDHGVAIIGWDDNYSKDNFKEGNKPSSDGAWIVKNSWGSEIRQNLPQLKQDFYNDNKEELAGIGINSVDDLTDEYMQLVVANVYGADKVKIENDEVVIEMGDNGFMYISYDDANVYSELLGIQKATGTKDYDHIYQYDPLGSRIAFEFNGGSKVYFGNKFSRDSSKEELLDKIAVNTMQEATFKVYVNANNGNFSELQEVRTKSGDSITLEPGYHVIELETPIALTGDTFIAAVSMETTSGEKARIMTENQRMDENVEVNLGESYYANEGGFSAGQWSDWNVENTGENAANVSVKALTSEVKEPATLDRIEITKAPNKLNYTVGENFSTDGMEVTAVYSDSTTKVVTNYSVTNGDNLQVGQNSVTISYTEGDVTKTAEQSITVTEPAAPVILESIAITKAPDQVEYTVGQNFSTVGMEVTATYSDASTEVVSNYTVTNGDNLQAGQTSVTISYTEGGITKTAEQAITVTEPAEPVTLENIAITKAPDRIEYTEGESFAAEGMEITATYSDGSTRVVTGYTVTNGDNLQAGQISVTISYTEGGITKTAEQAITVNEQAEDAVLDSIAITREPNKLEYMVGQNFSPLGMEVTATYSDGSTKVVTDYTITNGDNLQAGQTSVTISYTEGDITKTAEQAITVTEPAEPMLSNLDNMKTELTGATVYIYNELPDEPYMELQFKLSNIIHGNEETDYTYYFYLSDRGDEENIENWTRINAQETTEADGSVSISFEVDTRDIENFEELNNSDRIYMYIKEEASIGDAKLEQTKVSTLEPAAEPEITFYLDNQLVGSIDDVIDDDINIDTPDGNGSAGTINNNNDNTTAGGILPQTGVIPLGIAIVAIAGIGIWKYRKYKNMYK